MVEVTKSNFEEMLPDVEEAIRNASFIAIDAEFTGLRIGTSDEFSLFDSMNEHYQKLKIRASTFIINQIGISTFTKHQTKNCYNVKTYVFYIRPYLCGDIDKRFMYQASCVDFLCRYDFDFNKVFRDGIPFINEAEVKYLSEGLENDSINCSFNFLNYEDDMLINDLLMKSAEDPDTCKKLGNSSYQSRKVVLEKDKLYPEYFQLLQIRNKYPSVHAYVENDKIIVETTCTKTTKKDFTAEKKKALNFFLGFTKVFRLLKNSEKPIVGHNFLTDLLLCFHNFHEPLPEKYEDFKKVVHSVFPRIYDTRHMWRNVKKQCKLKNIPRLCGLFELYEMFKKPPSVISTLFCPGIEFCNGLKYAEGQFPHDSGYDSFVTGWVFINICHLIAMKKAKSSVFIEPQTFKQYLNAASPFVNRINLSRSRYYFIDFGGKDPLPNVPELLHICKKSNNCLSETELSNILEKYGILDIKLMRNKRQAVVAVGSLGIFRDILNEFKDHEEWSVSEYNMFQHSPYLKSALWLTAVGSACVVAFLFAKIKFEI